MEEKTDVLETVEETSMGEEHKEAGADEDTAEDNDENRILEDMGKPYEGILQFLWILHHRTSDIKVPALGILEEAELTAWETEVDSIVNPGMPHTQPEQVSQMTMGPTD